MKSGEYPRQSNTVKLLRNKVIMEQPSPIANVIAVNESVRRIYFRNGVHVDISKQKLKEIVDKRLTFEDHLRNERARMATEYDGGHQTGQRRAAANIRMRQPKTKSISRFNMVGHQAGFRDARQYH